jgi:hypothetical protein
MVEDAMKIVRGVRARYDGGERSPWNDVECGDHYARAMSSWTLLEAAAGQRYNAAQSFLAFAPKFTPHDFRCFFITSDGWGQFDQRLSSASQINSLTAAYGKIKLRTLELTYAGQHVPQKATAALHAKALPLKVTISGKTVRLESAVDIELSAGDRLQLEII